MAFLLSCRQKQRVKTAKTSNRERRSGLILSQQAEEETQDFTLNIRSSLLHADPAQRSWFRRRGHPCRDISGLCHTQMKANYFSFICNLLKQGCRGILLLYVKMLLQAAGPCHFSFELCFFPTSSTGKKVLAVYNPNLAARIKKEGKEKRQYKESERERRESGLGVD